MLSCSVGAAVIILILMIILYNNNSITVATIIIMIKISNDNNIIILTYFVIQDPLLYVTKPPLKNISNTFCSLESSFFKFLLADCSATM